jgi:hypothetical protein
MRCATGSFQLLQGFAHRRLTLRPMVMRFGMRGRSLTRPGLVQMRYQRVDFSDEALGVSDEFAHAL